MNGATRRILHKLTFKAIMLIYDLIVYPVIAYCNIIWGLTYQSSLAKLYSLRNKFLKLCIVKQQFENKLNKKSAPINKNLSFHILNKLSIYDVNKLSILKFVYNSINNPISDEFKGYFVACTAIHNHNIKETIYSRRPYK